MPDFLDQAHILAGTGAIIDPQPTAPPACTEPYDAIAVGMPRPYPGPRILHADAFATSNKLIAVDRGIIANIVLNRNQCVAAIFGDEDDVVPFDYGFVIAQKLDGSGRHVDQQETRETRFFAKPIARFGQRNEQFCIAGPADPFDIVAFVERVASLQRVVARIENG